MKKDTIHVQYIEWLDKYFDGDWHDVLIWEASCNRESDRTEERHYAETYYWYYEV